MSRPFGLLVPFLWCLAALPIGAQQVPTRWITEVRSDAPVLHLSEVVRLGSLDGPHDAFGRIMDVKLSSSGRILVADDQSRHVVVFGPEGRYIGTMGRKGQGPGEFQSPWQVAADPRDSVFVWDAGLARISVFDPDLQFRRSFRVPPQWVVNGIRFLPDGRLLVAAYGRNEPGALHVLSRSGTWERTFGPRFNAPELSGFESSLLGGTVALAGQSIVYSVKSPYDVWFFDLNGRPLRRCIGRKEWTTQPAEVVEVVGDAAALRWKRYVHSSAVLSLDDDLYLNQVLDPAGDRTYMDVLTADCKLLRRSAFASPIRLTDASGSRLAAVRNLEYPEVLIYEKRVTR